MVASETAQLSYRTVVRQVFERPEIVVTAQTVEENRLRESLGLIYARRKKFYPEGVDLP